MGVNGVAHHVVADDLEGVKTLLGLLAFAPPELGPGGTAALLPSADPATRTIAYAAAEGGKMDPRLALTGMLGLFHS